MVRAWYAYIGFGWDVFNPTSYYLTTVKPACRTGASICAIYATTSCPPGDWPLFLSLNLQDYISNALATGLAQPQLPTGAKKFVYLKYSL